MTDREPAKDSPRAPSRHAQRPHSRDLKSRHSVGALSPVWFFAVLWAATALIAVLVFVLEAGM